MLTEEQLLSMPDEEYMNEEQLEFFRHLLNRNMEELNEQLENIRVFIGEPERQADELDQALSEEDNRNRLRMADRITKLKRKVIKTLNNIDDGDYGYCKVSGEPIGLRRLLIRPTAELCAEEKARQESREHHFIKVR
ncbi:TraR/DksA family transcriptional regulator [Marinibactrum halimedae]|uniref:RNA polymerase-binding transcription factor DksA n=1 Tax=Marinibactrum halimedae TaxID=1444977 RepID=A0AA37T4S6_9GAMM|nr:TraR/DksA C4-type zinc finger protein [Marinibactrum halimedae]MCD9460382.1 TraR/DksA C4-type zinc finger protein [Marinibactrum halimedae]GLS26820.1 RNA polymerase-binding transcription factor DksA [Marinibactrum halimedae]